MRSPIVWMGGKGALAGKVLPLFPEHQIYVEPFAGGAALLFAKRPASVEVINDLDGGLVNFYQVLRDPGKVKALERALELTPYSRGEWRRCKKTLKGRLGEIERARAWFVVARQSMNGNFGNSWRFSITETSCSRSKSVSGWLHALEGLEAVHERLRNVQVEEGDFEDVIKRYDHPKTFFYCDPPYVRSTRYRDSLYAREMTNKDHERLLGVLTRAAGMVMVSGYDHPLYSALEADGWRKRTFTVKTSANRQLKKRGRCGDIERLENILMNYNPPQGRII